MKLNQTDMKRYEHEGKQIGKLIEEEWGEQSTSIWPTTFMGK